MFARSFRPAARAVRSARIARSYTATPVVRAQPQTWKGVTASSEEEAEREGGKILLMVGGAFGALFTIGSILAEQRKNRVHPSEPKEEVEEEVEEAAEEEVAEEAGVVETISGESPTMFSRACQDDGGNVLFAPNVASYSSGVRADHPVRLAACTDGSRRRRRPHRHRDLGRCR